MRGAINRPRISVLPPGGKAITSRAERSGVWAKAGEAKRLARMARLSMASSALRELVGQMNLP
jgi:hypothetical protein